MKLDANFCLLLVATVFATCMASAQGIDISDAAILRPNSRDRNLEQTARQAWGGPARRRPALAVPEFRATPP